MEDEKAAGAQCKYFKDIVPYPKAADPVDILYRRPAGGAPLPKEESEFKREIDSATRRVAAAFRNHPNERSELLGLLANIAFNGLGGAAPVLSNGLAEFEVFKQVVAHKANFLKQVRMYELFLYGGYYVTGIVAVLFLYYVFGAELANPPFGADANAIVKLVVAQAHPFLLGLFGLIIGFLLMGFVMNRELSFENFDKFDIYIVSVDYYMGYLFILFLVLSVIMGFGLIELGLGGYSFADAVTKPWIGFLAGLSTAIGEQVYSQVVVRALKPADPAP